MLKPAIDRFRAELRAAGPAVESENKLVVGRMVVTVWPALVAPEILRARVGFPGDYELAEPPLLFLFLQCVFGRAEIWLPLWRRAGVALKQQSKFSETVGGLAVAYYQQADEWILEIAAKS